MWRELKTTTKPWPTVLSSTGPAAKMKGKWKDKLE